jgi:hypothetical protein
MTSISKSEHEKMQAALSGLGGEHADQMKQELAAAHAQFIAHLEAARQSVSVYEKHYKAARVLLSRAVRKHKKEVIRKVADGAIQMHLLFFMLIDNW